MPDITEEVKQFRKKNPDATWDSVRFNYAFKDRNYQYCFDWEQVENYHLLKEMGIWPEICGGGQAYFTINGYRIELPLTKREQYTFYHDQIMSYIFNTGMAAGEREIQKQLKEVLGLD